MNHNEIVKALRDAANNWVIEHDGVKENSSGLVGLARQSANMIETLRNELCLRCGKYRQAHKGACKNCRWREEEGGAE